MNLYCKFASNPKTVSYKYHCVLVLIIELCIIFQSPCLTAGGASLGNESYGGSSNQDSGGDGRRYENNHNLNQSDNKKTKIPSDILPGINNVINTLKRPVLGTSIEDKYDADDREHDLDGLLNSNSESQSSQITSDLAAKYGQRKKDPSTGNLDETLSFCAKYRNEHGCQQVEDNLKFVENMANNDGDFKRRSTAYSCLNNFLRSESIPIIEQCKLKSESQKLLAAVACDSATDCPSAHKALENWRNYNDKNPYIESVLSSPSTTPFYFENKAKKAVSDACLKQIMSSIDACNRNTAKSNLPDQTDNPNKDSSIAPQQTVADDEKIFSSKDPAMAPEVVCEPKGNLDDICKDDRIERQIQNDYINRYQKDGKVYGQRCLAVVQKFKSNNCQDRNSIQPKEDRTSPSKTSNQKPDVKSNNPDDEDNFKPETEKLDTPKNDMQMALEKCQTVTCDAQYKGAIAAGYYPEHAEYQRQNCLKECAYNYRQ